MYWCVEENKGVFHKMSLESIYREQIMDHYRNPRNQGSLASCSFSCVEQNPFCGDEIKIEAIIENERICDIKFCGKGCSISQAAASMLTEAVKGKSLNDVKELTREKIVEMLAIPVGAVRIKCAVLSLVALKNGITQFSGE